MNHWLTTASTVFWMHHISMKVGANKLATK